MCPPGHHSSFLGAFAELRKVTVSFVTCVSVPVEKLGSHWTGLREILFDYFLKLLSRFGFHSATIRIQSVSVNSLANSLAKLLKELCIDGLYYYYYYYYYYYTDNGYDSP